MSGPIVLPGAGDPMLQQAQVMAEQQAMQKAMIEEFLSTTASRIYAASVAPLLNATNKDFNKIVPDLRERAKKARIAAMVLGEVLGMVRLQKSPPPVEHPK